MAFIVLVDTVLYIFPYSHNWLNYYHKQFPNSQALAFWALITQYFLGNDYWYTPWIFTNMTNLRNPMIVKQLENDTEPKTTIN